MRRYAYSMLIATVFPAAAFGATKTFVGLTTQVYNVEANSNFASLAAYKGSAGMTAGDTWQIIDAATSTGIVPTGGLLIDVGSNGSSPFTLDGGGKILRFAAATGGAAIKVGKSTLTTGIVIKNMYLENSGTNGMALYVDASSNVTGLTVQNVTISDSPTVAEGANQNPIRMDTYTSGYCYAWFDRVNCELTGQLDIVAYGDGSNVSTNTGIVYLTNCNFGGCEGAGSRNCVSQDSRCEMFIYGGRYHDSGGPNIDQNAGTATTRGRIHVYGAEIYNSSLASGVPNPYGVEAQTVVGCYIHDCPSGILLEAGSTELEESFAAAFPRGVSVAYGNYIVGRKTHWGKNYPSSGIQFASIQHKAVFYAENNTILNFDQTSNGSAGEANGIYSDGAANYPTYIIRNNFLKNCYGGVRLVTNAGGMVTYENNTLLNTLIPNLNDGAGYVPSCGLFFRSFNSTAKLNVLARNNFTVHTTDGAFAQRHAWRGINITQDARSGYNWTYGTGLTASTNGYTIAATDSISTNTADAPTVLANGIPAPGSAAAMWGKEFPTLGTVDYKPWHWATGACTNSSGATLNQYTFEIDVSTDGAASTNRWKGCSLVWLDANTTNAGYYSPIVSDAGTAAAGFTTVTVAAPFPVAPAIGNKFAIIPGIDGGAGDFLMYRHEILRPRPIIGGMWNFDGLNRVSIPQYVRGQTGTTDVLIARPPGWATFVPTQPYSGRPSEQRPSANPTPVIQGETKLQKTFK